MRVLQIEFNLYHSSPFDYTGWIELDNGEYTFQDKFLKLKHAKNFSFDKYYNDKDYKKICATISKYYKKILQGNESFNGKVKILFNI